jgi:DNA-binding transcriptional LysR family regulator
MDAGDIIYGKVHAHIAELHAFHVAASCSSFTHAARNLHLTQPALSQKIRRLEDLLGARLFIRRHRGVSLTEAGQQLSEACGTAFDLIERNFRLTLEGQGRKRVRLSTDFAFASHWLMARLPQLRDDLDGLDIQVLTSQKPDETDGVAVDLSISLQAAPNPDTAKAASSREVLFNERVIAVCSPEVARQYGPFEHPGQLLAAPLLSLSSPPNAAWHNWRSWFSELGIEDLSKAHTQTNLSNYTLVLQGAIQGQGIALGWLGLVDDFLSSGQLIEAGPHLVSSKRAYVIECAPEAPIHVRRVFDWISTKCSAAPGHRPAYSPRHR